VLRTAGDKARESVAAGDWNTALEHYAAAVRAVDTLGRNDAAAARYRQGLRETTALTALSSAPLLELLNEAEQLADDRDAWKRIFETRYRNDWLAFEAPLVRGESGDWQVDFPALLESNRGIRIHADLTALKGLKSLSPDQPVVFAAQLDRCELSSDKDHWDVWLRPDSGFLWVGIDTYRALGFPFNEWHPQDEVAALLARQAKAAGIEAE
jgi:hypothetical protein